MEEGDDVGWNQDHCTHYPVIKLKKDDDENNEHDSDKTIRIVNFGSNTIHAGLVQDIKKSQWKSCRDCSYSESERRLHIFMKRIQNHTVFKKDESGLKLKTEEFYVRELWRVFYPNHLSNMLADDKPAEEYTPCDYERKAIAKK